MGIPCGLISRQHLSKCVFRFAVQNIKGKICSTVISLVVLYGCETWYLKLREGHRLRVFEKRVLRKIFGPKRDEATGGLEKLNKKEAFLICTPQKKNNSRSLSYRQIHSLFQTEFSTQSDLVLSFSTSNILSFP